MKRIIYKLAVLTFTAGIILVSFLTKSASEENNSNFTATTAIPDTQFIISCYDNGVFNMYNTITDSLHFNTWHQYTKPEMGWNYDTTDNYLADTTQYKGLVTSQIAGNKTHGMRTIMSRPVIMYVGAGQRIDYQCENVGQGEAYWFWAYKYSLDNNDNINDFQDNSQYGKGEMVKQCISSLPENYSETLIDSGLRSNRELSFTQTNWYLSDTAWDWYIMPRIRIDSAYAAGTAHNEDTVCQIMLTGWRGDTVKNILIKIINFKNNPSAPYNGIYLDSFFFSSGQTDLTIPKDTVIKYFLPQNPGWTFDWSRTCLMDIKIYWSGKVDAWFDRVRVENLPAHKYLTLNDSIWISKINSEIGWSNNTIGSHVPNYFYFDECQFSHFPVLKELNRQIIEKTQNTNCLTVDLNYGLIRAHIPPPYNLLTAAELKKYLSDDDSLYKLNMYSYPFGGEQGNSYHPNTLSTSGYSKEDGILSNPATPANYDYWLQDNLDYGESNSIYRKMDSLTKQAGMKMIFVPQTHLWYSEGHKLKEPSNEEIELQTDLAITYNAKGIMYFTFISQNEFDSSFYNRGIMNNINNQLVPRRQTVYGQDKFKKICEINEKLNKWGPVLMSLIPDSTRSYIYRLQSEKALMRQNTYFRNFSTFRPGTNQTLCEDEDFYPQNIPSGLIYDCQFETYLQIAMFKNTEPNTGYFMIVNRRCSPYIDSTTEDLRGGRRQIRAYIKPNYQGFANFRNWSIINCETDSVVAEFDDTDSGYVNLGYFLPGEGRLYKIVPTMVTDGTLVCDEEIGNVTFECKGNINGNGHNIKINSGASISFHQGVVINMQGGNFICGDTNTGQYNITLLGKNGAYWNGLNLRKCPQVRIYGTRIDNAQNISPDTSLYSINLINCTDVIIQNSKITSYGVGAISSYIDSLSSDTTVNYFSGNVFELEEFSGNTVRFVESGYITVPVRIEYCTFNSGTNYTGNIAIFLSAVSAGSLKYNQIEDYNIGINLLNSSVDLLSNTISSSVTGSILVNILSGSNTILGYFDSEVLGGYNGLINSSDTSFNIMVDNSTFYVDEGNNNFRIKDKDTLSYHFYGNMLLSGDDNTIYATNNCFYIGNNIDTNICLERTDNEDPITAITYPMAGECSALFSGQMEVFQSDGGINDTIYLKSGGSGGAKKSEELRMKNSELREKAVKNVELGMQNFELKEKAGNKNAIFKDGKISYREGDKENILPLNPFRRVGTGSPKGEETFTLKTLYSDLCVQTRKRNYDSIITKATQIINQYPDSLQSLDAVTKLYFASLKKDSAGSKISTLKTYLEALILNNPDNTGLIGKSFYLIQKCKVALKQYTSALAGFQQIMTENPYTYEALLASWDYATTTLLMNGGAGGSKKSEELRAQNYELKEKTERNAELRIQNYEFQERKENREQLKDWRSAKDLLIGIEIFMDNYDTTRFKKTDRIKISDNTKKSFETRKKEEKETIEFLQSRSDKGDRRAQRELHIRKTINEVAKPVSPKSIDEHIKIINTCINKIFTNPNLGNNNRKPDYNIPDKYELYQNYPNPFNPVTKISFDLPKDSKVKLIVYDILGRAVIRLLNNEFKPAGKHIMEFNGINLNLSSGVYFYRIEIEESTGRTGKFSAVKKMVLIK